MRDIKKVNNRLCSIFFFLLFTFYFLLLISLTACGRRGDPIVISPYEKKVVEKDSDEINNSGKESSNILNNEEKAEKERIKLVTPDSPTGLTAIYTEEDIVLTWDEIIGQNVKFYKIYRSAGDNYILIGDTVTPAFIDKDVKQNMKYYYKVTAIGEFESPLSEEIEVVTEIH